MVKKSFLQFHKSYEFQKSFRGELTRKRETGPET